MEFFYVILIVNELAPNQFQSCFRARGTRTGEREKSTGHGMRWPPGREAAQTAGNPLSILFQAPEAHLPEAWKTADARSAGDWKGGAPVFRRSGKQIPRQACTCRGMKKTVKETPDFKGGAFFIAWAAHP